MNYENESQRITKAFLSSVVEANDWKQVKDSEGVKVFNRASQDPKVGNMYKAEVTLEDPAAKIFVAVDPSKEFRAQWDLYLEKLEVIKQFSENIHLIHHVTKAALKGIMSPRDSIDVVTTGETDDYFYVAAGGVNCPEVPPQDKYVRVFQYTAGFVIFKDKEDSNKCRFVVFMNSDLKMNTIASFVAELAKPKLLVQMVDYLRDGLKKINIPMQ